MLSFRAGYVVALRQGFRWWGAGTVEGLSDGGAAVAAAAHGDHGDGRVQFAQAGLQLAHGDVQGAGNHAVGNFEVLADVEDPGRGAALFCFGDGDFSHCFSFEVVLGCVAGCSADGFAGLPPGGHAAADRVGVVAPGGQKPGRGSGPYA